MPRPKKSTVDSVTTNVVVTQPKSRSTGLLGRFFKSTSLHVFGQVIDTVTPTLYLVQLFDEERSIIKGQRLIDITAAAGFHFYDAFEDLFDVEKGDDPEDAKPAPKTTVAVDVPLPAPAAAAPPPAPAAAPEAAPKEEPKAPAKAEASAEPAETGEKKRTCRICLKPGHNARTCPMAKEGAAVPPPPAAPAEAAPAPTQEKKGRRWEEPQELAESDGTPSAEDFEEGMAADEPPHADIIAALDKLHPLIGTLGVVSVRTGPGTVIIEVNGDTSEVEAKLDKTEEGFECCGMPVEFLTFTMEKEEEEVKQTPVEEKGHADAHPF